MVRGGSVKEVVLSTLFKREEDLGKGNGPSSLGEQLNQARKWKCARHVDATNGPLVLALRFGEVYWTLSEVAHA